MGRVKLEATTLFVVNDNTQASEKSLLVAVDGQMVTNQLRKIHLQCTEALACLY